MSSPAHTVSSRPARRVRLAHYARVLRVIAGTEWKLKYADSVLGYAWSLLKPLALFGVLYVVFGRLFDITLGFNHYPLYLLIGLVLWFFFVDASGLAMTSVVAQGSLLRRLAFPRLLIPLSAMTTAALTFMVNLIAIGAFVAWRGIPPRVEWLLLVPLVAELYVFTLGFGIILATLFVRFRDVGQLWELLAQVLFYASPIIYPVGFLPPWAQPVAFLSPFVQVMQDFRVLILDPHEVNFETVTQIYNSSAGRLLPIGVALATFAVGLALHRRESPHFAERV